MDTVKPVLATGLYITKMMNLKKSIFFIAIFFLLLTQTSCFCDICPHEPKPKSPCELLIESIENQGAQVIQYGDTLRIILPTDVFFLSPPQNTIVRADRARVFADIAKLSCCYCYGILPIRVTGYTDNMGTILEQKYRSLRQARNVAAYLWANNIPLRRIISVRGTGAQRSLATNETPRGEAYNRRVEITLP